MSNLVLWEFSKKQDYIFKSNKLIESVGASLIIKELSENFLGYDLKDESFIIRGGGKTLYLFDNENDGEAFIKKFSLEVLKKYPGLELFMVLEPFDIQENEIKNVISLLYKKLEAKKSRRRNSGNQLGFGIERECDSTGYPASEKYMEEDTIKYISSEIYAKRKMGKNNNKGYFNDLIPQEYKFTNSVEDLVNKSAKSYVAVIHIDGNGMGRKVKSLEEKVIRRDGESVKSFNERYIKILKKFSFEINKKYNDAFRKMCNIIIKNKVKLGGVSKINENIMPIRPLILAGDDVTFISNGYIGVEAARNFIENLNKNSISIEDENINLGKLHACSGVALIKKGFPFIKGYELAEDLCQNCKSVLLERNYSDASAIDFYLLQGDINKSLNELRNEEYSLGENKIKLTMKPLMLEESKDWKNYNNFIESLKNVNKAIADKDIGRNKVKSLREILKKGPQETEYFFKFYNIEPGRYFRDLDGAKGDYCFNIKDNICMYLDAIESMDLFIELEN